MGLDFGFHKCLETKTRKPLGLTQLHGNTGGRFLTDMVCRV